MRLKNIALICCCLFIGLSIFAITYLLLPGANIQELHGTALNSGLPDADYSIKIIYPGDRFVMVTPTPDGEFIIPADVDIAEKLSFIIEGIEVVSYGPPFSKDQTYTANIHAHDTGGDGV